MKKISVVLWDVGGVIQQDDRQFPRMLSLTQTVFSKFTKTEDFRKYLRGLIDFKTFATFTLDYIGMEITKENFTRVKNAITSNWEPPNAEVVDLIRRTDPARFRRMILSNCTAELETCVREAHKTGLYSPQQRYFPLFRQQDMIFSHRTHAIKPEMAAFEAVYRACNIKPAEWVFIDDRQTNLEGAKKYGAGHVVHHRSAAKTGAELKRLGVL